MSSTPPPDEHALHAYVDGRLAPAQRAAVAAWLQAHPAQAARVAGWKRDAEALRAAHAGPEPEMAAMALMPAAIRRGLQQRRRIISAMAASCVLALGLGTGLGWQMRESRLASQRVPMADAVAAYRLFADADAHHGVALDVQRRAELEPWLRTHFGSAGVVPDLRAQGYTLRGGKLLSTPEGAAAMLVYSDADGARIGLYLRPRSGPMPTGERRDGRLLAQYWANGDTAFALVGPATQTRMRTITPLLRNQG
ncbi:anti-sigma factor family protein [Xanthomonas vesicatoria]|uniref:anti-sigma factor family protein n=4 Tax=Xanthomonas vesicatoria TaxID=56460 RepID=UPI000F8F06B5|nr:anti-sigma factor [Xanthomonas vesicatoria]MCC8559533.1 anti-sigma factor [Xanthomonas vesicatoria]MCC8602493.1 anti-sigma factor [Xanthomonas vesicatoria]MCC8610998.1 anti-sigma factor [Xanthomonas vesicatoria]MCC8617593.1 anti-sigma factor [Xanthomonas vesicatoria]MCC8626174.1 anti-sigma factor [Xanthomonas vesicatoria]